MNFDPSSRLSSWLGRRHNQDAEAEVAARAAELRKKISETHDVYKSKLDKLLDIHNDEIQPTTKQIFAAIAVTAVVVAVLKQRLNEVPDVPPSQDLTE